VSCVFAVYHFHMNRTLQKKSHKTTKSFVACYMFYFMTLHQYSESNKLKEWLCLNIFVLEEWKLLSCFLFSDEKLSWLVGVLAAMVLILTMVLVVVSVCKCRKQKSANKSGLGNPVLSGQSGDKKSPDRYTDSPTKINFQFREASGRNVPTPFPASEVPGTTPQHIYERVDRYVSPTTCKSIYENVEWVAVEVIFWKVLYQMYITKDYKQREHLRKMKVWGPGNIWQHISMLKAFSVLQDLRISRWWRLCSLLGCDAM